MVVLSLSKGFSLQTREQLIRRSHMSSIEVFLFLVSHQTTTKTRDMSPSFPRILSQSISPSFNRKRRRTMRRTRLVLVWRTPQDMFCSFTHCLTKICAVFCTDKNRRVELTNQAKHSRNKIYDIAKSEVEKYIPKSENHKQIARVHSHYIHSA